MVLRETLRPLRKLPEILQGIDAIDSPASKLNRLAAGYVGPDKALAGILGGADAGHPLHPMLTDITIGAWTAAVALDLLGGKSSHKAADRLIALGVASSGPTALSGLADWETLYGPSQRLGMVHAASNAAASSLFLYSWLARKRGRRTRGVLCGLLGISVASFGGFLGGHLSYRLGAGVDHTAFAELPSSWTEVASEADLEEGRALPGRAGDLAVMVLRQESRIYALVDNCAHQGGPLHQGTVGEGCITCPWHQSVFRLSDGEVTAGPSAHPQPVLDVRVLDGRIEVKAREAS